MTTVTTSDVLTSAADRRRTRYRAHAEICKVLTDPKRLMLIDGLRRGARSVGQLAEEAGLSLANTSQHLAVLRHAGLVDTRRAGTSIHYRLSAPELVAACDIIERIASSAGSAARRTKPEPMFLQQLFVKGLGHASYLIGDESAGVAAVIDPRRDVDAYVELAQAEGLRITDILETHVHNDYVSGAEELRHVTGATVRVAAEAGLTRPHQPLHDGDELRLGSLRIRTIATPGHTPEHPAFAVADLARSDDDWVLFSGGALLVGTAARPDLLGGPEEAARAAAVEFATLRERIAPLPDWVELYPTHGAGSLCGSGIGGKRWSTIGYERRHNPALSQSDADAFRRYILADQPTVPAYWRRMRPLNQAGASPLEALADPRPMTAEAVEHAAGHDAVIVDTRDPAAFAAGHIPGALGIGLADSFGTWVGSVVPGDREVVLVLDRIEDLEAATVQLRRAGYDRVAGYLLGGFAAWRESGRPVAQLGTRTPEELAAAVAAGSVRVLDVREASEWREGHIAGALHVPGGTLPTRIDDVPADRPLAVVCGSGYRSTVAASLLLQAGRRRVSNLVGGMTAYRAAGHPLSSGSMATPTRDEVSA